MSPTNLNSDESSDKFLLGLVEGFYGRPFTSDQRKDLFKKLKKFGHQLYVYAPKDDYKVSFDEFLMKILIN
jgi:protein O-GlcNAcase / histone acetyltransferase